MTDDSCVSCACQQCSADPSAPQANLIGNEDGDTYVWGDPFPIQTNDCGWRLQGRAFTLRDPNPCNIRWGLPRQLGWYLQTGTTQTLRLPNGTYRTYFAAAALSQVTKEQSLVTTWPAYDSNTNPANLKFSLDSEGQLFRTDLQLEAYWKADSTNCQECHFSKNFVGFLDSVDGIHYPFYAPKLTPTAGTTCSDISYMGSVPVFEEAGFRAGWRSTSIPASKAVIVYRDVSVVYVPNSSFPDHSLYLMVAVQCDGTGMGANGADIEEGTDIPLTDSNGTPLTDENGNTLQTRCMLCTPNSSIQNQIPKTKLVFFLCNNADFQDGVRGPFVFNFPELDRFSGFDEHGVFQQGE